MDNTSFAYVHDVNVFININPKGNRIMKYNECQMKNENINKKITEHVHVIKVLIINCIP